MGAGLYLGEEPGKGGGGGGVPRKLAPVHASELLGEQDPRGGQNVALCLSTGIGEETITINQSLNCPLTTIKLCLNYSGLYWTRDTYHRAQERVEVK